MSYLYGMRLYVKEVKSLLMLAINSTGDQIKKNIYMMLFLFIINMTGFDY